MQFKLYKNTIEEYSASEQILYNRGIVLEKQAEWLNANQNNIHDWRLLDETKMRYAAQLVKDAISTKKDILVLVDCDCDGWTSSALLINYLYMIDEDYVKNHVHYIQHTGKQHGLTDVVDIIINDYPQVQLAIIPDAGSNDIVEHAKLSDAGIDVIVFDHHECDVKSEDATIINNQLCDYPNKNLTGAGVTWQFCRCYDELYRTFNVDDYADNFIDLAALGNCGDMADYRNIEIRALINVGFANIRNPFFLGMSKKNAYSINKMNGINYLSVAFYVVPFINAMVRSGTPEEKDLVFKSFLLQYAFEEVESSKRGEKGKKVKLYDEAILVAERVKRRQTKLQDETLALLEKRIEDEDLLKNALLLILCEPGEVEKNLAGLIANKLQAKYQRPCAILTKGRAHDEEEYHYRGSMRNYSLSEKNDLKRELESTELVDWVRGHANAAGMDIQEKNIEGFIHAINQQYKDVSKSPIYWVDYIWNKQQISSSKILDIAGLNIYGQEIPESMIALDDISITSDMVTLMGVQKGNPTLKIQIGNVPVIKFKSSEEEFAKFQEEDLVMRGVAKCAANEWNGDISPQLLLEDYQLKQEWSF